MDKQTLLYYRKEMNYLNELKADFVKNYPKLTPFLSNASQDPELEYLIENFAILTAKIKQEMDNNIPIIAETLLNILSPNFTAPIPSVCLQSFSYLANTKEGFVFLPPKTKVFANYRGTRCVFETVYGLPLYPIDVDRVELKSLTSSQALTLHICSTHSFEISQLEIKELLLFLGIDIHISTTLLMWFFSYLQNIEIVDPITQKKYELPLSSILNVGLSDEESIFGDRNKGIRALCLLQEFLLIPDKFNFIKIKNIEVLNQISGKEFEMNFYFSQPLPSICTPNKQHFSFSVSPIVNNFRVEAEPFVRGKNNIGHQIVVDRSDIEGFEVLDVTKVVAHNIQHERRALKNYKSFERFEFFDGQNMQDFYSIQTKVTSDGRFYKEISFFSKDARLDNETITIETISCNSDLPKFFGIGDIQGIDIDCLNTQNIVTPTPIRRCEIDGGLLWRLVSVLTVSYEGFMQKHSFLALLRAYNLYGSEEDSVNGQKEDIERIAEGLLDIKTVVTHKIFKGIPKRGIVCTMQFDQSKFYCVGEIYRLGLVFSRFLDFFASINSFCHLRVECFNDNQLTHCLSYPCIED